MGKRRKSDGVVKSDKSKTLNSSPKKQVSKDDEVKESEENNNNGGGGGGFFGCYLLNSLNPRFKGHSYIGFTVNPRRRIRQHNGEIRCGAHRTKSKRPWEMALCIYGFPSNVSALQFEWAWQHPTESLAVRKAAVAFKSLSGIANKIKLAFTMLTLPTWHSLNLTVNFFSTKYQTHCAGCPCLLEHMKVQVCSMDELPCYTGYDQNVYQNEELGIEECEGTENGTCYNSLPEHENESTECVKAHRDYTEVMEPFEYETGDSFGFCRNWNEEKTPDFSQNIEENSFNQPINESERDDRAQPPFPIESPEAAIPSVSLPETFEGGTTPLGSPCSVKLVWSSRKSLQMRAASVKDKPLVKSSTVLCDIEVIDVCTPEPSCGLGLQPKKRRIDFSEIIDLTESPIFILS